jgi:hypothetical protein
MTAVAIVSFLVIFTPLLRERSVTLFDRQTWPEYRINQRLDDPRARANAQPKVATAALMSPIRTRSALPDNRRQQLTGLRALLAADIDVRDRAHRLGGERGD